MERFHKTNLSKSNERIDLQVLVFMWNCVYFVSSNFLLGTIRSLYLSLQCFSEFFYMKTCTGKQSQTRPILKKRFPGRLNSFMIEGPIIHRNKSTDLLCKSVDWFLYDRYLRHERVKSQVNDDCYQLSRRYLRT